jgi:hypothetical protein
VKPEVAVLGEVYELFYKPDLNCLCTDEHKYPDLFDENGDLLVCPFHEWRNQVKGMRKMLDQAGLSLPIPRDYKPGELSRKIMRMVIEEIGSARVHPNSDNWVLFYTTEMKEMDKGGVASLNIAKWLADNGHIVVRLDRTAIITRSYSGMEEYMRDVLTYAPVLVFWDNRDNRNGTWIESCIRSRQSGIAVVVK